MNTTTYSTALRFEPHPLHDQRGYHVIVESTRFPDIGFTSEVVVLNKRGWPRRFASREAAERAAKRLQAAA